MGVNEGNSDFLVEKWEIYGLKRPKIKVSVGNEAVGGGALVKAPEEKWGKMGENGGKWGKMGENGEKWGKMGRKWGGNGRTNGGVLDCLIAKLCGGHDFPLCAPAHHSFDFFA